MVIALGVPKLPSRQHPSLGDPCGHHSRFAGYTFSVSARPYGRCHKMGQGAKFIRPNFTGNNFVLAPPTVHIMEDEIEEITSFPTPLSRPAWFMSQYEDAFRAAGSTPDDLQNSEIITRAQARRHRTSVSVNFWSVGSEPRRISLGVATPPVAAFISIVNEHGVLTLSWRRR